SVIKHSLVERLRSVFHIETVGESTENFTLTGAGKDVPCHCVLNVLLKADSSHARLIIDGSAKVNALTKILYVMSVLVLLVLGQFHGSLNTTGGGSALDLMVFLFLGIFILHDMNKKLAEPQMLLDRILRSLTTEFGS